MTNPSPDVTGQLAGFAADLAVNPGQLPPTVARLGRDLMLNAAAAALAGAAHPDGIALARVVRAMGGNGRSTIIGMGQRTSPVYAALVNGTLVRLLDYDDNTADTGAHPTAAVFPAVMALGEMHGNSGAAALRAFAAGGEIAARLATDANRRGGAAAAGAAAASGMLLGLDAGGLNNAIGLALGAAHPGPGIGMGGQGAGAAGLAEGRAAMHGVMAALLAAEGFAGALADPLPASQARDGLGTRWHLTDPGVTIRLYPCHPASHSVIDAVLGLAQLHRFAPDDIARVHVGVTAASRRQLPYVLPTDGWQARACLGFIAAATLRHGPPLINFFTDVAVGDAGVRALMERVSVEATLAATPLAAHPAEVEVTLNDGRRLGHRVDHARGTPAMPLDADELEAKFLYCTSYILPADHIDEAVSSFRNIAEIDNITGMASVLGG